MLTFFAFTFTTTTLRAQIASAIPVSEEYTMLYEFLDELNIDGVILRQTAIRPYSRGQVAAMLSEALTKDSLLSPRQREELAFYSQEFALELDTLPDYTFYGLRNRAQWITPVSNLSLIDPSLHLRTRNGLFTLAIRPILGMDLLYNRHGLCRRQRVGAEIRMDIVRHVSVWGSLRDNSYYGSRLDNGCYLLDRPGLQYKEATNTSGGHVGDYSDMRGGVKAYAWWGSIGVQRESVRWGEASHASNILSGHNPAVPMLTMQLTPCPWFQFDYFHAWLVSNVLDSTSYYRELNTLGQLEYEYRPAKKYMAANMFTFTPIKYLSFSIGNSIIYGESTIQAAYFIPFAFYKSLDHLLTKGVNSENQNSQVFGSISVRPWEHIRLYSSLYIDEVSFSRLKKNNPENNPISYLVGFEWSGWPVRGLSLRGEFLRSYIACYTHSIEQLTYASNSYNMGHYLGDNAQSIFLQLRYRPVRGLSLSLEYLCDTKFNEYAYLRDGWLNGQRVREGGITETISQKPFNERTWRNDRVGFHAVYEVFQNCYAHIDLLYNYARAFETSGTHDCTKTTGVDLSSLPLTSEWRGDYLNRYTPLFYQGKNVTFECGLNFGF